VRGLGDRHQATGTKPLGLKPLPLQAPGGGQEEYEFFGDMDLDLDEKGDDSASNGGSEGGQESAGAVEGDLRLHLPLTTQSLSAPFPTAAAA
jgi:hypothetical protein